MSFHSRIPKPSTYTFKMVSAGMKIVKYLLFIFNFIFLITGIALISVGAYVHSQFTHYFDFVGGSSLSAPILLIVVGSIISVVAFFGCCGACKENYCMIITFSVFLTIIFFLELGGGIAAYIYRGQLSDIITKSMNEGMANYNKTEYKGVTKTWDVVQNDFDCCGVTQYSDWEKTEAFKVHKLYPSSCCIKGDTPGCGKAKEDVHHKGCFKGFLAMAESKAVIVGGVGIGIAVVQVMGIVFACCFAYAIKREYEVV